MDMMDVLLELADDPNLEVPIKRDNVKAFILVSVTNPHICIIVFLGIG